MMQDAHNYLGVCKHGCPTEEHLRPPKANLEAVASDAGGQGEEATRRQHPEGLAVELHVVARPRGLPRVLARSYTLPFRFFRVSSRNN